MTRRRFTPLFLAASYLGLAPQCEAGPVTPLEPPFNLPKSAQITDFAASEKVIEPVVELENRSRYDPDDPSRSTVDPKREKAYERSVAPLRDYMEAVVKKANRFVASGGNNVKAAAETGGLLLPWAASNALSQITSGPAQLNRSTALSAIALAYIQVRGAFDPESPDNRQVAAWLGSIGKGVTAAYEGDERGRWSMANNHRYWAGLAAAATGLATTDRTLLGWGTQSARIGLDQVTKQGALPLELARGRRALSYHAYAVAPLVVLAEIDARNERALSGDSIQSLHRLVDFTLGGLEDPAAVARLAGFEQEPLAKDGDPFERHDIAWLEMYEARYPGRTRWSERLSALRPLSSTALGGNLTVLCSGSTEITKDTSSPILRP